MGVEPKQIINEQANAAGYCVPILTGERDEDGITPSLNKHITYQQCHLTESLNSRCQVEFRAKRAHTL